METIHENNTTTAGSLQSNCSCSYCHVHCLMYTYVDNALIDSLSRDNSCFAHCMNKGTLNILTFCSKS